MGKADSIELPRGVLLIAGVSQAVVAVVFGIDTALCRHRLDEGEQILLTVLITDGVVIHNLPRQALANDADAILYLTQGAVGMQHLVAVDGRSGVHAVQIQRVLHNLVVHGVPFRCHRSQVHPADAGDKGAVVDIVQLGVDGHTVVFGDQMLGNRLGQSGGCSAPLGGRGGVAVICGETAHLVQRLRGEHVGDEVVGIPLTTLTAVLEIGVAHQTVVIDVTVIQIIVGIGANDRIGFGDEDAVVLVVQTAHGVLIPCVDEHIVAIRLNLSRPHGGAAGLISLETGLTLHGDVFVALHGKGAVLVQFVGAVPVNLAFGVYQFQFQAVSLRGVHFV